MSEMIDRIALVIRDEPVFLFKNPLPGHGDGDGLCEDCDARRKVWRDKARDVMLAMRDPTEEMLQAVYDLHTADTFWDNSTSLATLHTKLGIAGPIEDFQAMIAAALK